MTFKPIAIIGQACLLPQALNPQQLWENIIQSKDCLRPADPKDWRIHPKDLLDPAHPDHITTDRCGYVSDFETCFNPEGFFVPAPELLQQDRLCQWLSHLGREALNDAGYTLGDLTQFRTGAIIGNLSYPTAEFSQYVEAVWLMNQAFPQTLSHHLQQNPVLNNPQHRFMSGYPVQLMAKALGLHAPSYALDAACASALYALQQACHLLHTQQADLMLAGGINATDGLFLNLGFQTLNALSLSGQSRPLHEAADGLIPAQGASVFLLKRLEDAVADHNPIAGVILGIGLSNDGKSRGFLVPMQKGQVQAMRQAYQQADILPEQVSWVECHATGTALGDATEIASMQEIYAQHSGLAIGALKGNIGHTVTASGGAALNKVLAAFKNNCLPPTLYAPQAPTSALKNTPFRLLAAPEPWQTSKRRIAAINCFGFGGNNAHLLISDWQASTDPEKPGVVSSLPAKKTPCKKSPPLPPLSPIILAPQNTPIAIVGIGILAASAKNCLDFINAWQQKRSLLTEYQPGFLGGYLDQIALSFAEAAFPPTDLKDTFGQQLALLKAAQEAMTHVHRVEPERCGVWMGMGCDTEGARSSFGTRLANYLTSVSASWLEQARSAIRSSLTPAAIIGAMPNIVANRLNLQFDAKAPSFTVSAEEISGLVALHIGIQALENHSLDLAMVGAVDINCETAHRAAASQILPTTRQIPGDAAVVLILKRLQDAQTHGDAIHALIPPIHHLGTPHTIFDLDHSPITRQFGHAHAASGLVHVAAAALACQHTSLLSDINTQTMQDKQNPLQIQVNTTAYSQPDATWRVTLQQFLGT